MKKTTSLLLLLLIFQLISCNSNNKKTNTDSSVSENDIETNDTYKNDTLTNYLSQLQGVWKRQSYPFGKIIVKDEDIKFAVGEGLAEPAQFQKFKLLKNCSDQETANSASGDYDFAISTGNNSCNLVSLKERSFTIYFPGSTDGVLYSKQDNTTTSEDLDSESDSSKDEKISTIRKQYSAIQNLIKDNQLTKERMEFVCKNEDGDGHLVRYYNNGELVMMEYMQGVGHAYTTKRLYFENDQLFFLFVEDSSWTFSGPEDGSGERGELDTIKEYRYYIDEGEILRKLKKEFTIRSWADDPESSEIPNEKVPSEKGKEYPNQEFIAALKKGNINC